VSSKQANAQMVARTGVSGNRASVDATQMADELDSGPFWSAVAAAPDVETDVALRALLASARATYPDLEVDRAAFLGYLGARFEGPDIRDYFERIDGAELLLVFACAGRDARALARFERDYFGEIRVGASRLRCAADELDDVTQEVRRALFVPRADGTVPIATMTARGDLRALIRLIALRAGISLRRKQGRAPLGDQPLVDVFDDVDSPSQLVLKHQHRQRFRAALEVAMDALDARDRALLKLHSIDAVPLAKLAAMHRVDRSTISRWLQRAREAVCAETRRQLVLQYGVDRDGLDSFVDVIRSNFGASMQRLLGAG